VGYSDHERRRLQKKLKRKFGTTCAKCGKRVRCKFEIVGNGVKVPDGPRVNGGFWKLLKKCPNCPPVDVTAKGPRR